MLVALIGHWSQFAQLSISGFAWRVLVDWLGHRPKKVALVSLFLRSNLQKYLPGGIWHFVDRLRVLRPHIGVGPALASVLLEPLLMAAAALLFVPFGGWQSGLSIACCLPAVMLIPRWREPLLIGLERAKASQLNKVDLDLVGPVDQEAFGSGRVGYPWSALAMEMLFVVCRFAGFWCCVIAFSLNTNLSVGGWLAAFALAWSVGLVVPGAPVGLGVFEATLLLRVGFLKYRKLPC